MTVLRVHLDRLDDLIEVVGYLNGPVREARPPAAPAGQHLVERFLVARVIRDRRGRVLQLMSRQDTHHTLISTDDPFLPQLPRASDTRRRRRLTSQPPGAAAGPRVDDVLVGRLAHVPASPPQRPLL